MRAVAAATMLALMALTLIDVTGRYVFNAPLYGAYELTELGMGVLVFAALPLVTWRKAHVTVDLFRGLVDLRTWRRLDAFAHGGSGAVMLFIAWRIWIEATNAAAYDKATAALLIPLAPLTYYMSVMAGFTGLVMLALAWLEGRSPQCNGTSGR